MKFRGCFVCVVSVCFCVYMRSLSLSLSWYTQSVDHSQMIAVYIFNPNRTRSSIKPLPTINVMRLARFVKDCCAPRTLQTAPSDRTKRKRDDFWWIYFVSGDSFGCFESPGTLAGNATGGGGGGGGWLMTLSLSLFHAPRVSRARTMHAAVVLYIHPNLSSSSVVAEKTHGFFPWLKRGAHRHHVCARWRVSAPNKSRADLISDWCSQDGCMRNLFSYRRIRACTARDTRDGGWWDAGCAAVAWAPSSQTAFAL